MCALLQPASGVSLRLSASDAAIGVRLEAIDPATDKVRASAATAVTTSVTDAVVASQVVARAWGRGAATFVALPPAATPPAAAAAPAAAGVAAAATGLAAEVAAIASGVLAGAEFIIQGSLEDVHAGMGSASARHDRAPRRTLLCDMCIATYTYFVWYCIVYTHTHIQKRTHSCTPERARLLAHVCMLAAVPESLIARSPYYDLRVGGDNGATAKVDAGACVRACVGPQRLGEGGGACVLNVRARAQTGSPRSRRRRRSSGTSPLPAPRAVRRSAAARRLTALIDAC